MDFYRAEEAIAEGQRAAEKTLPFLQQLGLGRCRPVGPYRSGGEIYRTSSMR
jgi:hypothetical protein